MRETVALLDMTVSGRAPVIQKQNKCTYTNVPIQQRLTARPASPNAFCCEKSTHADLLNQVETPTPP